MLAVSLDDIERAGDRLAGSVLTTPLLESGRLNGELGLRLLLKAENLQHTGSFKYRGALNRVLSLTKAERSRGVVTFSSGNHAHALAAAASRIGCRAVVVMPADAPAIKVDSCRYFRAEVVLYDRATQSREAILDEYVSREGLVPVLPFDDPDVIAGQGTIGLEIAATAERDGFEPDAVIIPCSGGGLSAGISTVIHSRFPSCECVTVEPDGFDKMARSLRSGTPQHNDRATGSLLDALMAQKPGRLTFPLLRAANAHGKSVSDEQALAAIAVAFSYFKVVLEPGGAAALASVLKDQHLLRSKTVVVVASGGNVDLKVLRAAAI